MSIASRIQQMSRMVRMALVARVLAGVYMLALYFTWAQSVPEYATRVRLGIAVYTLTTVATLVAAVWKPQPKIAVLVGIIAVGDSISFAALTAALGMLEDPFFSWYVADAAGFAVVLRRRESWMLSALLSMSYLLSHVLAHNPDSLLHYSFLLFKVSGMLFVGGVVAVTVSMQEQRRRQIESQQDEVLELYARLERSVAELRAVTQVTEIIHSTLDIDTVGPQLLDILHDVLHIPASCIYVIDKGRQEMVFSASRGVPTPGVRGLSALEIGGTVPISASAESAFACVELIDNPDTLVVFCAETGLVDTLTHDDRIVLQTVASELVVAVENSRLYRLTKRLAITDELTDLYNYRYLQQRLDEEIGRADRYGKRLSLLMLDVDNFKSVNDAHGHRVGDGVLAEIGHVLKSTVREVDVVARYGGEEFSVILPETDASGAFIVAEKIREAISLTRFRDEDGERRIHVTVSLGLASYPVHAHDKESLLRAADDAVYRAKEGGKNRVRAPRLRLSRVPAESVEIQEVAE